MTPILPPIPKMPPIEVDSNCRDYWPQSWWEKLWRKPLRPCVFMLRDGTLVCSLRTKALIDAGKFSPVTHLASYVRG